MTAPPTLPSELATRYEVVCELGRGGFGVVLRCRDRELGRDVALKLLDQALVDEEQRARFEREAALAAGMSHPNVLVVYTAGLCTDGRPYLVSELVEGEDMGARRVRAPRAPEEADLLDWGRQLAEALGAVHAVGLVHRDVKPENALLRGDHLLLADFGLARQEVGGTQITAEGIILGTPGYMAPELWQGLPATAASDQWAWGATLYRMVTGEAPLGSDEPRELFERVAAGAAVSLSGEAWGRHPRLRSVVARSLDPDPTRRFADMGALVKALDGGPDIPSGSAPTLVLPSTAPPTQAPPSPWASRLLVAGLVLGALLLGFRGTGQGPPPVASPPGEGPDAGALYQAYLQARGDFLEATAGTRKVKWRKLFKDLHEVEENSRFFRGRARRHLKQMVRVILHWFQAASDSGRLERPEGIQEATVIGLNLFDMIGGYLELRRKLDNPIRSARFPGDRKILDGFLSLLEEEMTRVRKQLVALPGGPPPATWFPVLAVIRRYDPEDAGADLDRFLPVFQALRSPELARDLSGYSSPAFRGLAAIEDPCGDQVSRRLDGYAAVVSDPAHPLPPGWRARALTSTAVALVHVRRRCSEDRKTALADRITALLERAGAFAEAGRSDSLRDDLYSFHRSLLKDIHEMPDDATPPADEKPFRARIRDIRDEFRFPETGP